jgi:hypothetical protein
MCYDNLQIAPDEAWDDHDEGAQVQAYQDWLARADQLKGVPELPSVAEMADELERGLWAKWAPVLRQTVEIVDDKALQPRTTYTSPGSAIEERWTKLGITRAAGVDDFGWWTTDAELDKVIAWASGYQVRKFL